MRTITPAYFTCTGGQVSPTYEVMNLLSMKIMLISEFRFRFSKIHFMPDFTPNAHMLEKFADKGNEPWAIYAWCVRDAISKKANIAVLDEKLALKDKEGFEALMNGWCDSAEINGQIFSYDGD